MKITCFLFLIFNAFANGAYSHVALTSKTHFFNTISAGNDTSVCQPTIRLNAPPLAIDEIGSWYIVTGSGILLDPANPLCSVTGLSNGNSVFLWSVTNTGTSLIDEGQVIITNNTPDAAHAGTDQTLCTDSTLLSATPVTIGTGQWNILTGTGITIENSTIAGSKIITLPQGISVLEWEVSQEICESRDTVWITNNTPDISDAGTDAIVCTANITLGGNNPSYGTGTWSVIAGGGNIVNPMQNNTTIAGLSPGTNTFLWTIVNGVCTSLSAVNINFNMANAGANQEICTDSAYLNAGMPTVNNGQWNLVYPISGNSTDAYFLANSDRNTIVRQLKPGNNIFEWQTYNTSPNSCNSTSMVTVVSNVVSPSYAGSDQTICTDSTLLTATPASLGTGEWNILTGTGIILNNGTIAGSKVSHLPAGISILEWKISSGICESRDTVLIINNMPGVANAGADQIVCISSATISGNNPLYGSGMWSLASGAGTILNPGQYNTPVTGLAPGANSFLWTITNGACTTVSTVNINYNTASAGANQEICTDYAILQAGARSVNNGQWSLIYPVAGNASDAYFTDNTNPNTTVSQLKPGINILGWSTYNTSPASCSSQARVTIVSNIVTPSDAGSNQILCTDSTLLSATPLTLGTGQWTILTGSGILLNSTVPGSTIKTLPKGTTTLEWKVSKGICISRDTVSLTNDTPTISSVVPGGIVCTPGTTISGNNPLYGNGNWSVASGGSTIFNSNQRNTSVTGMSPGINSFLWTITKGTCISISTVNINFNQADAGVNQEVCIDNTVLNAGIPTVNNGDWFLVSPPATGDGSDAYFDDEFNPNTPVHQLKPGINIFLWRTRNVSPTSCLSNARVTVVSNIITPSNAGIDQVLCSDSTLLSATPVSLGTGIWHVLTGTGILFNATISGTKIKNLSEGTTALEWYVSKGICQSRDTVLLTNNKPTKSNAGTDQVICSGNTYLNANAPTQGMGKWFLYNGTGTIVNPIQYNTQITSISVGNSQYIWVVSFPGCPNSYDTITVTEQPSIIANAGVDRQICTDTVTVSANTTPGTGMWKRISGSGIIANPANYKTLIYNITTDGISQFEWQFNLAGSGCAITKDTIAIDHNSVSAANAGANVIICTDSLFLSAVTPAKGTGNWSVVTGSGVVLTTTSPVSMAKALNPDINIFRWQVVSTHCSSAATVTVTNNMPTFSQTENDKILCTNADTLKANTAIYGTGRWRLTKGAGIISDTTSNLSTVGSLGLGKNVFVWVITKGTCISADSLTLTDNSPSLTKTSKDTIICSNSIKLNIMAPQQGSGYWSVLTGTGTILNATFTGTSVTGISAGKNTFLWNTSNGACSSVSTVNVNFNSPYAGTNQVICADSATLNAGIPTVNNGQWTLVYPIASNSSDAYFTNNINPNTTVRQLKPGINILGWKNYNTTPASCIATAMVTIVSNMVTPSNAGPNQSLCTDSTFLSATPVSLGTGTWNLLTGSGIVFNNTVAGTKIKSISEGISVLEWHVSKGICHSRDTVLLINNKPTKSNAGPDQVICVDNTYLNANAPTQGTGKWFLYNGSGNLANPTQPNTQVTGISVGTSQYIWVVSFPGCSYSYDTVNVKEQPFIKANAGADKLICADTVTVSANTVPGTGMWKRILGSGIIASPTNYKTLIYNITTDGISRFEWQFTAGVCATTKDTVDINHNSVSVANAGINKTTCIDSVFLSAVTPVKGTGSWSVISGTGVILTVTSPVSLVKMLNPNNNIFQWRVVSAHCSSMATMTVTNNMPTVSQTGGDKTICNNADTLKANAAIQGTGQWTLKKGSGTISNTVSNISRVSNLGLGRNVFSWIITKGACSSTDSIALTNNLPSLIKTTKDTIVCANGIVLNAAWPSQGYGYWSVLTGTGVIVNATFTGTSVTGMSPGKNVFLWNMVSGSCTLVSTVNVNFNSPDAGAYQEICTDNTVLSATSSVNNGQWTLIYPVAGNATDAYFGDEFNPNTSVNQLKPGTNIFRWRAYNISPNSCNSFARVTIVSNIITPANAGTDQVLCSDSTLLSATPVSLGTGIWNILTGTGMSFNTTIAGSKIKSLPEGKTVLEWYVSKGICKGRDTVLIINNKPTKSNAGADQVICSNNTSLNANLPTQGAGKWLLYNGTGTFLTRNQPNTSVTGISVGNNQYIWVVSFPGCPYSYDTVAVTEQVFVKANAGTDKLICTDTTTMNANTVPGTGIWRRISGSGIIASPASYKTLIYNITTDGISRFEWQFTIGGCITTKDTIDINHNSVSIANAGTNKTICTDSIFLKALLPTKGTGNWSVVAGSGLVLTTTSPVSLVKTLSPDINIFQWQVISAHCSSVATVTITNNMPTVAQTGSDKIICSNADTLKANAVIEGTGRWTLIKGSGSIANTANNVSKVSNLGFGKNTFNWTITKVGCTSKDSIVLFNNLPSLAKASRDTIICVNEVKLNAILPLQGYGFWSVLTGTGIVANTTFAVTSVTGLSAGINVFLWTVSTTGCTPSYDSVIVSDNKVNITAFASDTCLSVGTGNTSSLHLYGASPNMAMGEKGFWISLNAPDPITYFPDVFSAKATVSGLTSGFYTFIWSISDVTGQCSQQDTMIASIVPQAVTGSDQCLKMESGVSQLSTSLISSSQLRPSRGETSNWSYINTSFTPTPVSPTLLLNSVTGVVSGLKKGVHTFRYTTLNTNSPTCESKKDVLVAIITEADAGPDLCVTGVNSATLIANSNNYINPLVGGKGIWSSGTSGATINQLNTSTSVPGFISNLQNGINQFYFTVSNINAPACKDIDTAYVTKVTTPDAGKDSFLIASPVNNEASLVMYANAPNTSAMEIGRWVIGNGSSTAIINSLNLPNTSVSGFLPGVNSLIWVINNTVTGCSISDTINVLVQTKANAGTSKIFKNPNPRVAYTALLSAPNTLDTLRGEYGEWTLLTTNAPTRPISTPGANLTDIQLSNLRRGVSIFRWTIYNSNFPTYSNFSDVYITVMTKAVAGNDLCITDTINLTLGNKETVPIRPSANERFGWKSDNPLLSIIFNKSDSIPIAKVINLPVGRTTFYFSITNTGTNATDSDTIVVTKVNNPHLGNDTALCVKTFKLNPLRLPSSIAGESFRWTKLNGNSQFSDTGYEPVVAPLDTGNNRFIYTLSNQDCSFSDTINVRNNAPYYATITGLTVSCFTSNVLQGNNPKLQFPTATGKWKIVSQPTVLGVNTASIVDPTTPQVEINQMVLTGNFVFQWTISNLGCSYSSAPYTLRRENQIYTDPGTTEISICSNYYAMNADSLMANVTGTWTKIGPSGDIANLHDPKTIINNLAQTPSGLTSIFEWRVRSGECSSEPYLVKLTAFTPPTQAKVGSDLAFCEQDSVYLQSIQTIAGIVGTPKWYLSKGTGTFNDVNAGNTMMKNIGYGNNQVVFQVTNGVGCAITTDTLNIQRFKRAADVSLGASQQICGDSIRLNAPVPDIGIGKWYFVSTLTASLPDSTNPKALVVNATPGLQVLKWKVVNGLCADSSTITFKVGRKPSVANITAGDTTICDTALVNLPGNRPLIGTVKWSSVTTGNKLFNDTSPMAQSGISNFGENKFLYTVSEDFCSSTDSISFFIIKPPTKAYAGKDTVVCKNEIILTGNNPVTGYSQWLSLRGTPVSYIASDSTTINATGLLFGTNTFVYIISVAGCAASEDSITLNNGTLIKTYAGKDTTICTDTFRLTGLQPVVGSGLWSIVKGTGDFSDDTLGSGVVSSLAIGENIFIWTNFNNKCPALSDSLIINNRKIAALPSFSDKTVYVPSYQLTAAKPVNGTGQWHIIRGSGNLSDPTDPGAIISSLGFGENVIRWSVSNQYCDSSYADQKIILNSLKIPSGFSPNKDVNNINEKFEIAGIEEYPNASLEVFNRWGKSVYKKSNYKSEWDGTTNENEPLVDDSYFYILILNNDKPITGYVQIRR